MPVTCLRDSGVGYPSSVMCGGKPQISCRRNPLRKAAPPFDRRAQDFPQRGQRRRPNYPKIISYRLTTAMSCCAEHTLIRQHVPCSLPGGAAGSLQKRRSRQEDSIRDSRGSEYRGALRTLGKLNTNSPYFPADVEDLTTSCSLRNRQPGLGSQGSRRLRSRICPTHEPVRRNGSTAEAAFQKYDDPRPLGQLL